MKETKFWEIILSELQQGRNVILCTVVQSELSSPGRAGFKMAVFEKGNTIGTIGGGFLEYKIIRYSHNYLNDKNKVNEILKFIHSENAEEKASGMICEGSIIINLQKFGSSLKGLIVEILNCIKEGKEIGIRLNQFGIESFKLYGREKIFFAHKDDSDWIYEEILSLKDTIYIFGAGHVGSAVAKVFSFLNFYVKIFDDRKEFLDKIDNNYCDEKILCKFDEIADLVNENQNTFAVIVTRGHKFDKIVLKQLVNKNITYLGMMGSKAKVNKLFNELLNEGISEELLKRVHAPIGLSISSQTPEEIAISIAAEIIKIKNKEVKTD